MGKNGTYRSTRRFVIESLEGVVFLPLIVGSWPLSKRWLADWGSKDRERARAWAGDALAPTALHTYTRGVDVSAPAGVVWRWVVQFGLGRAGFYSYEVLDRLIGIPVRNVEVLLPAHQELEVGAEIKLHPEAPGIPVGAIEMGRHICFGEDPGDGVEDGPDPRRSWSIYVEPVSETDCRLILRSCVEGLRTPTLLKRFAIALETPIDFAMEQRMLRTIKRLSETEADGYEWWPPNKQLLQTPNR